MTPNVVEFGRLAKSQNIDTSKEDPTKLCEKLATALGGVTIIQKGQQDCISNGTQTLISDGEGGFEAIGWAGVTRSRGHWRRCWHIGERIWIRYGIMRMT